MNEIKLYKGDCLIEMQNIPDKSIDLIVTDPPYELDNHGGGQTELAQRKLIKHKHIDFISKGFDYDSVFSEFVRICKTPNILLFCSNDQIPKVIPWFEDRGIKTTLLVWHKTNPSPLCNGKYLSDIEFIIWAHGKGAIFNNTAPFSHKSKVYRSPIVTNKNRLHPTQKSIAHITRYIELHSNEGDVILDCFMGSGSTGVACVNTNRNFIGIELNEEYFTIAEKRIKEAQQQLKLFYQ